MYESKLEERKIRRGKYVYNFDETGARIGCPRGEEIVVPIDMKEKYTPSPENRKSVSIMEAIQADGSRPPPLANIVLGRHVMVSWVHDNLQGEEVIFLSDSGYTNEKLAMNWLKHFIEKTDSDRISIGRSSLWMAIRVTTS